VHKPTKLCCVQPDAVLRFLALKGPSRIMFASDIVTLLRSVASRPHCTEQQLTQLLEFMCHMGICHPLTGANEGLCVA
jgi:hypothetical protein